MTFNCFVIGEGTLLIECATILSQRGFLVNGIISDDPQVHTYCHTAGLPYIDSAADWAAILTAEPFDYLFSIANGSILPEAILRLPRLHTVNYHDGPLPAYAGVNATFWALVNGEKTHGITWHLVDRGIDTGAIVRQNRFLIEPDETSISLNIKCYAAAVDSFQKLIDDLTSHKLIIQPQDLTQRSYYARHKWPDLLINWSVSAAEITRLHRALDFGFGANPFGLLKIWTGDRFWLVSDVVATSTASQQPPGPIESILPDILLVATRDFSLTLSKIRTLDGELLSIAAFCEQADLGIGYVLSHPEPAVSQIIQTITEQCARHQAYWVNKRLYFQSTTLSWAAEKTTTTTPIIERIDVVLSAVAKKAIQPVNEPSNQVHQLLTALLITLARLTNQPSVSVGYRSHQSAQLSTNSVGLLADSLPLQIEFEWESSFEQACTRVRQAQAEVDTHLTFARETWITQPALQARAGEFADSGYPILVCLGRQALAGSLPGKSIMIGVPEKEDGTFQIVFDAGIWSAYWVAELVNRWQIGLEQLISQPNLPLRAVHLLTGDEQRQILHDWNATAFPYPRDQLVCQLVETQVMKRPQAEALRCGPVALTYEQLNQRANQLARYLQKQGVTPNMLVGLCLERSPEMVISLLAILKAGGAYVPLDPSYPAARLHQLISQTGVQHIITRKAERDRLPPENRCILVDDEEYFIAQQSDQNLAVTINAEAVAYVLFTSGSTGQPKGVAISHRAIGRTVQGANYLRLNETVCMLGLAPLAFDASTLEIWGSLANGGRLVLVAQSLPSLEAIKQTIQTHGVNTAFFTTALFNVLVDSGIDGLTTLTQLAIGGEAASAQHVVRARRQLPACQMVNGYGPTESTTFASFFPLSTTGWEMGSVPIGRPVSNTQLYIVDSFLNPMPVGMPGELLIGGDGLAIGYLNEPDLTAKKFIANPFSHQAGARLYRTGDLTRYLADGTIEFLGRLDDQLKIRGFRIEPAEIEQALCRHPAVGEALVLADTLPSGVKRLIGYVVPKGNAVIQPDKLRAFLKTTLPDYLIPNVLVPLNAIPL
ncbi:MAG: adpA, partial [Spirosoma sp.]|nr:adpA [Spirosoma sp.]